MNVVGKVRRPRPLQQILMYAQPWLLQTDGPRSHMQSCFLLFMPPPTFRSDDGPSALNQAVVSVRVGTLAYHQTGRAPLQGTHKHPSSHISPSPGCQ